MYLHDGPCCEPYRGPDSPAACMHSDLLYHQPTRTQPCGALLMLCSFTPSFPLLLRPWLPVTGYRLTLLTEQLLYRNTPDFTLGAPLCLLLTTFQFPYHFRRALSPYMVQEMLMADGSTSEVLWTHVQRKRHSRPISSTSTVL
jgi:hypothetical protein